MTNVQFINAKALIFPKNRCNTAAAIVAEEVEAAIKFHDSVYDCVVTGRPSERWGNEVVAVVRLKDGRPQDVASLLAEAENHIARYKLPKEIIFVESIVRSPAGKADYRWAKQIAIDAQS